MESEKRDKRLWRRALSLSMAALCTLWIGVATPGATAEEMTLRPGDTLRVRVDGLPGSEIISEIGIDGIIRLGWFGTFPADGKTLSEMLFDLQSSAEGRVFKRYSGEGELSLITPRPEDIFLDIAAYRPVVIGGDVVRPGEFPYRANMTLRGLLALSGGPRLGPAVEDNLMDPVQMIRLQSDYNAAVLENARARLEFWRLTAELEEDFDAAPPAGDRLGVTDAVAAELASEQRQLLSTAQQTLSGQRNFLAQALQQAKGRVDILLEQQSKLEESLRTDEEEEARIRELLASGLAMASRSSDARRATILSATRLLDVEDNLARAKLDVTRLIRDKDEFEQARIRDLSTRRDNARNNILAIQLRLDGFGRMLASQNMSVGLDSFQAEPVITYTVYRRIDGAVSEREMDMDELLLPGDIIEVFIEPLAPMTLD